jgi:hypothetical protein
VISVAARYFGVRHESQHVTDHFICWDSLTSPQPSITPQLPYATPSIGAFIGNSPLGVLQGMPHVVKGTGESLLTTPGKCEKRRKQAASGGFLLDTFLCPHKEKYPACQCGNWHLINCRGSDTLICSHPCVLDSGTRRKFPTCLPHTSTILCGRPCRNDGFN